MISYKEKLNNIKTVILDVDGVLTDGNLILLPTGEMVRTMNTRDGYAMQLAIKQGIRIAVITGGRDEAVVNRLKYLGLTDIYVNRRDKVDAFQDLLFSNDKKLLNYYVNFSNPVFTGWELQKFVNSDLIDKELNRIEKFFIQYKASLFTFETQHKANKPSNRMQQVTGYL